jgi:hypothetical protein
LGVLPIFVEAKVARDSKSFGGKLVRNVHCVLFKEGTEKKERKGGKGVRGSCSKEHERRRGEESKGRGKGKRGKEPFDTTKSITFCTKSEFLNRRLSLLPSANRTNKHKMKRTEWMRRKSAKRRGKRATRKKEDTRAGDLYADDVFIGLNRENSGDQGTKKGREMEAYFCWFFGNFYCGRRGRDRR